MEETGIRILNMPKPSAAAMMRMTCNYVSVLDYTQGLGHTEELRIGGTGSRVLGDLLAIAGGADE